MKRILLLLVFLLMFQQASYAWSVCEIFKQTSEQREVKNVKQLLVSQVRYANKENFKKFIDTYSPEYRNADGFNLDVYSSLIKDIWNSYDNIKYDIDIKDVQVKNNTAIVNLVETSYAKIPSMASFDGELTSSADTTYYLEKIAGKWKVVSDKVADEITTMLYGDARNLELKLTVPNRIQPNTEYCAILEFTPPEDALAIASIAADKVEYPQKPTKEVFRTLPEDNILERLFTSNTDSKNEYVVASIGLTKTSVCDMNVKFSLVGYGYAIRRVNVIANENNEAIKENLKDLEDVEK